MPPKRRGPPRTSTATTATAPKKRASKLAKEHDLSSDQETEIKEAFNLFSAAHPDFAQEKEGVIAREDVRKTLVALGLAPSDTKELTTILSAIDPTNTGYVPYAPFLSVAAAKLHARGDEGLSEEVDVAYRLFTRGSDGPITLGHLRRIARELKEEEVGDELLKDMILEANGGDGVQAGVSMEQFRDVLSRAGVF